MDMKKMMKQAQRMQRDLAIAQEEITKMEFESTAGGGMVKVVVTGEMEVKSVEIAKEAVDPDDVEMLQDLVLAAVNDALRTANQTTSARLESVTGGMNLPF